MIIFIVLVVIAIGFFTEAIRQEIKYRETEAALNRMINDDFENLNRRYGTNLPTKIK